MTEYDNNRPVNPRGIGCKTLPIVLEGVTQHLTVAECSRLSGKSICLINSANRRNIVGDLGLTPNQVAGFEDVDWNKLRADKKALTEIDAVAKKEAIKKFHSRTLVPQGE